MTYKVLGISIAYYATPVWNTNASESNSGNIQRAQNEELRIIACSHSMSSIDHLHSKTETSFINRATDNMTDNRVLNNRFPPITDEEIHLSTRQRAPLSQLRFGLVNSRIPKKKYDCS